MSARLCECGCGEPAPLARKTNVRYGHRRGEPLRFINGHQQRVRAADNKDRFLEYLPVNRNRDECWEWLGTFDTWGYPSFSWRHGAYEHQKIGAHRISHIYFIGPIPDGLEVDHLCRNKRCVNPSHLEAVTKHENRRRVIRDYGKRRVA